MKLLCIFVSVSGTCTTKMNDVVDKTLWQTNVRVQIPFHDVDSMEVVWHGHYARYFELARCQLLEGLKSNYQHMREAGLAWPVIKMSQKFIRPAVFNQKINIHAEIKGYDVLLEIGYIITDVESGDVLTRGSTTQVAVDVKRKVTCIETPEFFRKNLGVSD